MDLLTFKSQKYDNGVSRKQTTAQRPAEAVCLSELIREFVPIIAHLSRAGSSASDDYQLSIIIYLVRLLLLLLFRWGRTFRKIYRFPTHSGMTWFKRNLKNTVGAVFRDPWTFSGCSCWRHCVRPPPRDAFAYPHSFRYTTILIG